eukprot:1679645-Prymnesium_polylepis.1
MDPRSAIPQARSHASPAGHVLHPSTDRAAPLWRGRRVQPTAPRTQTPPTRLFLAPRRTVRPDARSTSGGSPRVSRRRPLGAKPRTRGRWAPWRAAAPPAGRPSSPWSARASRRTSRSRRTPSPSPAAEVQPQAVGGRGRGRACRGERRRGRGHGE